ASPRELGRHQPKVTETAKEFRDLIAGRRESLSDRRYDQLLAEADLDRLEEGNEPARDQGCRRLNLVRRAVGGKLGERLYQFVPAAGRLQPVEVAAQLRERHSCSSRRSMNAPGAGSSLL